MWERFCCPGLELAQVTAVPRITIAQKFHGFRLSASDVVRARWLCRPWPGTGLGRVIKLLQWPEYPNRLDPYVPNPEAPGLLSPNPLKPQAPFGIRGWTCLAPRPKWLGTGPCWKR